MKKTKTYHKHKLVAFALFMFAMAGCTDLVNDEQDSVVRPPVEGSSFAPGNPTEMLASAYKDLGAYNDQGNMWAMQENTTAECIPPTRSVDWGDNGVWRAYDTHNWTFTHPQLIATWNQLNRRAYKCNEIIASNPSARQAAQAKFLRAFNMYQVMDFFGKVPFREVTQGPKELPRVMTRSEAFDFIVKDLEEAIPDLVSLPPAPQNGEASKEAAYFLLARLYLNKAVYKSTAPEGPYNFEKADMDKVIGYVNSLKTSGYGLDPNYYNAFSANPGPEVIWASTEGVPSNLWNCTLHYNMNPSGWNGFATLSEFYDKFENSDIRKGIAPKKDGSTFSGVGYGFLIGQQYTEKGEPITDTRTQKLLAFTRDVPLTGAATDKGIRVIKYHPATAHKFVFMRYGQAAVMKAEALLRSGNAGEALKEVNALRAIRKASPLASLTNDIMFDETSRESYWEGIARTNEVRFSKFATGTGVVNKDPKRAVFPIPSAALVSNTNLTQNDGY
ncbi:SusD family protein [Dyadobacter soli]|uniref:SusD family protein n=1 Tax=Dyadobacter soli TaxID=659014 RepID=A0A1G7NDF8_9BACT|nr:RagB/SusD family nutrient uptake outer membrane protein [Dyadobacter soli]SDF71951.1 SusD family protein [Dyadobacter soli]